MVVTTIFFGSVGVEIIQESKHFIDFVDSDVYMTRRGQINALLFIFRTSKNYKLTERVGFEPTNSFLLNDFESFAFDHSATSPPVYKYALNNEKIMNYIIILIFNSNLHLSSI